MFIKLLRFGHNESEELININFVISVRRFKSEHYGENVHIKTSDGIEKPYCTTVQKLEEILLKRGT